MSGYWQLPLAPDIDDIEKTAFTTPFGLFEFPTMPFNCVTLPLPYNGQWILFSLASNGVLALCILMIVLSFLLILTAIFKIWKQYSSASDNIVILCTKESDILCTWLRHTGFVSILRKSMMLLILKSLRISLNSKHFWVLRHIIVAFFRHTQLGLSLYFDYFVITCLFNGLITNSIHSMNSNNFLLQRLCLFILTRANHFSCRRMRLELLLQLFFGSGLS